MRQSDGKTAVSNDRWKMSLSAGARVSAQFLKMTLGIWLGPHALWGLMALSNLHSPALLMLISLIIGCCGGSMCGGADPPSLVKTLWNWSRRISAFSLLSHTSESFFFTEATPMLSYFLLLIYFQKGFKLFVWSPWVMVLLMYSHSAL